MKLIEATQRPGKSVEFEMKNILSFRRAARSVFCALIMCLMLWPCLLAAQTQAAREPSQGTGQDEDDARGLVNERFIKPRPKGKKQSPAQPTGVSIVEGHAKVTAAASAEPAGAPKPQVRYRRAPYSARPVPVAKGQKQPAIGNVLTPPKSAVEKLIGITIWSLDRAAPKAESRQLVHEKGNTDLHQMPPVRVEAETPLFEGERVRLSIESPSNGYLYVIDREQYANGSLGQPFLIFPTMRTRGGDNRVEAGRLIDIPSQQDETGYLTVRPSRERPDQVGELLTVLVCEQPLKLNIGRDAMPLDEKQVLDWEYRWQAYTEQLKQVGGAGQPITPAELEAGRTASRQLVQEEATPQTIYRVLTRPGDPLLVSVLLPLRSAGAGK
jgi:hypothetical protein